MSGTRSITRTGASDWADQRSDPARPIMRTVPELDSAFDPFDAPLPPMIIDPSMWFTADAIEDEVGFVGAYMRGPARVLASRLRERTRVTSGENRTIQVVFDNAHAASNFPGLCVAITGGAFPVGLAGASLRVVDPNAESSPLAISLREVQDWLGVSLHQAAEAAGISRGTVYAWRDRDSVPRPATVQNVLRLHGLVASAVRTVGEDSARKWFHAGQPSPMQRLLAARGDDGVMRQVSKQLRKELTAAPLPPPNPWLAANRVDASD